MQSLRTLIESAGHGDVWQPLKRDISIADLDRYMEAGFRGPTDSGIYVTPQNSLEVSAAWACQSALAHDLATINVYPYIVTADSRELARRHYTWTLLQKHANPEMTAFRFRRLMQMWVLGWGNAYAEIEISDRGQVKALWPWHPSKVRIQRKTAGGPLVYQYRLDSGQPFEVPASRMLHLRGLETDGYMGLSPVEVHRNTIGLAKAIQKHGNSFYRNGARPLGVLEHPGQLGEVAANNLRETWQKTHGGLENAHRVAILEEGMKYHEVGMKMVDAQYLDSYKFTVEETCRIYGVPPHRIGHLERSTNNNIEHQGREYVQYSLAHHATNWKQEMELSLLSERESKVIEFEFDFTDLTRGDVKSQAELIKALTNAQAVTPDEVREMFGYNPLPNGWGVEPLRPLNMVTPTQAEAQAAQAVTPKEDEPNV